MDMWCKDCKEYDKEHHNCPRFNHVIRTALDDADMVRVVRCKECKWWVVVMGENNSDEDYLKCPMDKWPNADDYCSYGERKENK